MEYGDCRLHRYRIVDFVSWVSGEAISRNYEEEAKGRAWIPAYSDPCPNCDDEANWADFAVVVDRSRLESVVQAPLGCFFPENMGVMPLRAGEIPVCQVLPLARNLSCQWEAAASEPLDWDRTARILDTVLGSSFIVLASCNILFASRFSTLAPALSRMSTIISRAT